MQRKYVFRRVFSLLFFIFHMGIMPACTSEEAEPTGAEFNPFPNCSYEHKELMNDQGINVMIPMRDCVHLSTNVHTPTEKQSTYPVILVRTPYGKSDIQSLAINIETLFVTAGFVTIIQDTRGRYDSEGEHIVLVDEPDDTYDTLAWIEKQPWFDGRIGIWGASYLAMSAIAGAVLRPDMVDAVVVAIMGSDFYTLASDHGLVRADGVRFATNMATDHSGSGLHDEGGITEYAQKFPLSDADVNAGLGRLPVNELFINHTVRDQFWDDILDYEAFRKTELPIYMLTGWFDFQWRSQVNDYNAIYANRKGKDHYLNVGPWPHLLGFEDVHDFDFQQEYAAVQGLIDSAVFMKRYVKGEDVFKDTAPVIWYDGGAGEWHEERSLWPAETTEFNLYPAAATAVLGCPGRLLSAAAPAETTSFTYDPYEPFFMPGTMTLFEADVEKEAKWCGRSDSVVFESELFTDPIQIAGAISVDLEISTNVEDTPFVARLSLVDVDGRIYNLREGVMLLSHREGDVRPLPYTPATKTSLTVSLPPLRWTLQPGQKIRIGIASSAWPLVTPHPNVAGDWVRATEAVTADQTVYLGQGSKTVVRLEVAK